MLDTKIVINLYTIALPSQMFLQPWESLRSLRDDVERLKNYSMSLAHSPGLKEKHFS